MRRILIIAGVIIFIVLLSSLGWYYFNKKSQPASQPTNLNVSSDYLIKGVPYWGFYQLYLPDIAANYYSSSTPTTIAAIKEILDFWGDGRFSFNDLRKAFQTSQDSNIVNVSNFFDMHGYQTATIGAAKPTDIINNIKIYVNPQKNTPVLVLQKNSLDPASTLWSYKVIIGVLDSEKKIVVHDYYYGNNYEISYDDFIKMSEPVSSGVLAIWPTSVLDGVIKGAQDQAKAKPYPARLEAMDKVGSSLAVTWAEGTFDVQKGSPDKAIPLYKEFVDSENFKYLPPKYQVSFQYYLARAYLNTHLYDEVIALIEQSTLPINHNLDQPSEGWYIGSQSELVKPYILLSEAYLAKGDKTKATTVYEEMKKIVVPAKLQKSESSLLEKLRLEIEQAK